MCTVPCEQRGGSYQLSLRMLRRLPGKGDFGTIFWKKKEKNQ